MSLDGVVSARLEAICRALDDAGLHCEVSPEVGAAIWEKVAFNSALNALTAVTGLRIGAIADSPEATDLARRVAEEVVEVANRTGIGARREAVLATIAEALAEHREHQPSMLQDMIARRRTEVGSLNGAVVREAKAVGLGAPFTEALYLLVRTLESRFSQTEHAGPEGASARVDA
jgi:2-dehydropantoate 2-reductase